MPIPGLRLTAIPRGYDSQRWRVSLCIDVDIPCAPGETLAKYSEWLDWPEFLNTQLTNADQLSQQLTIDLTTPQGTHITVSDVKVHPPDRLPFQANSDAKVHPAEAKPVMEKYWSTGWRLLFPSNIPVSVSTTNATACTQPARATTDRFKRKFLSYDPIYIVDKVARTMLSLSQTTRQARISEPFPNSRNQHATPGPRRQEIQAAFADFRFFLHQNDSAFEKYNAQLLHDQIFGSANRAESNDEGRQRLIAALGRIQESRITEQFARSESIAPATSPPFLTAQTYAALAEYYGYSAVRNARIQHPQAPAQRILAESNALVEALLYHTAGSLSTITDNPVRSFMERLLLLRHQPSLRKLLGLILDISFEANFPINGSTGFITVDWPSARTMPPLRTAFEQWSVGSKTFFLPGSLPLNAPDDLDRFPRGLLNVNRPLPAGVPTPEASGGNRYALGLVEGSGTFFKAQQDAQPAGTSTQAYASNDRASGLAPLRSTGLALFDRNMTANANARQLRDQCLNASINNMPCPAGSGCTCSNDLYAEDLLLGLRPDIAVASQDINISPKWTPLGARNMRLEFLRISGGTAQEIGQWDIPLADLAAEGFISPSLLNDGGDTKAPPELFRYYNFGLGVDLPLKDKHQESLSDADLEMPVRTVTSAPSKSFLCLKHEQEYWVRVRAAFLDGSGLPAADLADEANSRIGDPTDPFGKPIRFLRTRQIGAPTVLLEESSPIDKRPGESLTTVVRRAGGPPLKGKSASRILVPPAMSPFEVYEHGKRMVDNGKVIECLRFRGEEETWPAHQVNIPAPSASNETPMQRFPYWRGALRRYRPGKMSHAFLPDILAASMEITITSGPYENQNAPEPSVISLQHFPSGSAWPFFRPVKLEVHHAQKHQQLVFEVVARPNDNSVKIYVRPGAKVNVEAQYVANPQTFLMGAKLISFFVPQLEQTEDVERHWLLSQATQLTLVHAVPDPIERPRFTNLALKTPVATETTVEFDCEAVIHWASTGKIEIWAKWEDPVDDPAHSNRPGCESREIMVKSFDIPEQTSVVQPAPDTPTLTPITLVLRHAIGDFKHHRITYGIRGVSRYTSFFPAQDPPAFDWENEDTRELSIPNRSQLDPLAPLHVIPLLRREFVSDNENRTVAHFRRARYLRVYLSREFYPSGEGELVGLVFARQRTGDRNTENTDLYGSILGDAVSVWGQAPTWKTTDGILHPLSPDDFPGIQGVKELVLTVSSDADAPQNAVDLPVAVAGFNPWYDTKRELWCCDIPLPRRSVYRPLVRLGLVRYQPNSCDNLHISSVVSTAFSSVMPDRLVTVRRLDRSRHEVTMYGVAPLGSYLQVAHPEHPERTIMELRVEERPILTWDKFSWTSIPFSADSASAKRVWEIRGQSAVQHSSPLIHDLLDDETELGALSMWKTTITIPGCKFAHSYRLLVREREDRLTEAPAAAAAAPVEWNQLETNVGGRYIYLDEIPL